MLNSIREKIRLYYTTLNSLVIGEIWFSVIIFLIIVSTSLFLILTNLIRSGILQRYDNAILYFLRKPEDISTPIWPIWVTEMLRDITSLGSGTILSILVIAIAIYLILKKEYKILFLVLLVSLGGFLVDILLKYSFSRERPSLNLHLTYVSSQSFPSGHSMMSAAIYLSLAAIIAKTQKDFKIRIYLIAVAALLTFLIGTSRIYLGVHYPSDVLAGWLAGYTWAAICWVLMKYFNINKSEVL